MNSKVHNYVLLSVSALLIVIDLAFMIWNDQIRAIVGDTLFVLLKAVFSALAAVCLWDGFRVFISRRFS